MRSEIEFHDSTIAAIVHEGTSIRLNVDAYVHRWEQLAGMWKGTGWGQPIQIIIASATCTRPPELPAELGGGDIRVSQVTYDNMVPLPFASSGPVTLRLELKTGGMLEISGQDIMINATGDGSYVEDLPDEFKPSDAG